MSVFAQGQEAIKEAAAAAAREVLAELDARIQALEERLAPAEDKAAATRKGRGTTVSADTATASGSSN